MAAAKQNKERISAVSLNVSDEEEFYSLILKLPKFVKQCELEDFIPALKPHIEVDDILSLGKLSLSGQWQLTLKTPESKDKLLQKRVISVCGKKCTIGPYNNRQVIGRIHWLPIEVQDDDIKSILKNFGTVVHFCKERINADQNAPESLVRFFVLNLAEDTAADEIPHFIMVNDHQGLVIVRDRDPMCLLCSEVGHKKSDCPKKSHAFKKTTFKKKSRTKKKSKKVPSDGVNSTIGSANSIGEEISTEVLFSKASTSKNKKSASKSSQAIDLPCSSSSSIKPTEQIAPKNLSKALGAQEGVNEMVDEVKNLQDLMNVFSEKINQVLNDMGTTLHDTVNKSDARSVDPEVAGGSSVSNIPSSNKPAKKKKKKRSKTSSNYDLTAAEAVSNETSSSGQYSPKGSLDSGIAISGHSSSVNASVNVNEIQNRLSKVESVSVNSSQASNTSHTTILNANQKKKKKNKKKSGSSIPGLTHP